MTICEDDLPLAELASPCHHCLDPQEYIALLPPVKVKRVAPRYQPLESMVDKDDRQREKWNAYMRMYRSTR